MMQNNTKKYREQTSEMYDLMMAKDALTPGLTANAFPLKVNGDERFVIRIGLDLGGEILAGEGTAVHNPVDDFDPKVGILLASSRAYAVLAENLKASAYRFMMDNAEKQKDRHRSAKAARRVKNLRKASNPGYRSLHQMRLLTALDDGRVFYCQACKGHFANNREAAQSCPHCGTDGTRQKWVAHRLDGYKADPEPKNKVVTPPHPKPGEPGSWDDY